MVQCEYEFELSVGVTRYVGFDYVVSHQAQREWEQNRFDQFSSRTNLSSALTQYYYMPTSCKNSSNFIEGVGHAETQQGIDRQR